MLGCVLRCVNRHRTGSKLNLNFNISFNASRSVQKSISLLSMFIMGFAEWHSFKCTKNTMTTTVTFHKSSTLVYCLVEIQQQQFLGSTFNIYSVKYTYTQVLYSHFMSLYAFYSTTVQREELCFWLHSNYLTVLVRRISIYFFHHIVSKNPIEVFKTFFTPDRCNRLLILWTEKLNLLPGFGCGTNMVNHECLVVTQDCGFTKLSVEF